MLERSGWDLKVILFYISIILMSLVLQLVAIGSEAAEEEDDEMTKKAEQQMAEQTSLSLSETKESKEIKSTNDESQNSSQDAKDKLKGNCQFHVLMLKTAFHVFYLQKLHLCKIDSISEQA